MENESFKILEYEKITAMLEERAGSALGKEKARLLFPSSDIAEIAEWQQETDEAVQVYAMTAPPLGGIRDIRPLLKKAGKGAVLDLAEMQEVMSTLYAMRNVKYFFRDLEAEVPLLKEWARSLEILGQLERNLGNTIDEHGNMREDASVELRRIRRELKSSQVRIKDKINSILHDAAYQKMFQDAIVTVRDERYVLPVKAEYRAHFPGLIHDQSASGSTLFIEPMAVVELNNDVKQLTLAEQQEVQRILRQLSQEISRDSEPLTANCMILADIDFAFAKAKLARDMEATRPLLNTEGRTVLKNARHPLIPRDKVVPTSITLGDGYRMLLITGPNTGGKTVSMKTLGLMVLMAQSGCYLPVAADSEIAVYQNVYADIGDEQSIEQSLSTFSAHMTHIVRILDKVESDDLLLLDELGAGTDPEEGAALAMSILERLLDVRATTVATTHYSELKTFAYTREGIENACVEFDVETLRPTYRLLIGIPGASNAFAISQRLGLSDSLILRAKQLVKADHAQFEHVINQLENEKMMYEQMNADIRERQQRVTQLERKLEDAKAELAKKKGDIIRKAKEKSAAMIRQTRRESEEVIKDLKEQFDDQGIRARQQAIQEARAKINEASDRARPGIMAQKGVGKKIDVKTLVPGDVIYVKKLDQKGTVLEVQGKELTVQLGGLRTKVKASGCTFLSHAEKEKAPVATGRKRTTQSGSFLQKTQNIGRDIDIRGMMVDEAEVVLGKFIDDAVIAGLTQVLVIHGKGTGALRKGVHEYFKHHRNVAKFQFADINEGGTGATIVDLK
ncbi:MAG: endonuclease MutS2 [Selenomonas ruminantium]|jgi:DNA mismatch repair protein MutS2|nr:endonuclease MutS2 [Selenomonas ruminantium]